MPTVLRINGYRFFFYSNEPLPLGSLKGNKFTITVRNLEKSDLIAANIYAKNSTRNNHMFISMFFH